MRKAHLRTCKLFQFVLFPSSNVYPQWPTHHDNLLLVVRRMPGGLYPQTEKIGHLVHNQWVIFVCCVPLQMKQCVEETDGWMPLHCGRLQSCFGHELQCLVPLAVKITVRQGECWRMQNIQNPFTTNVLVPRYFDSLCSSMLAHWFSLVSSCLSITTDIDTMQSS